MQNQLEEFKSSTVDLEAKISELSTIADSSVIESMDNAMQAISCALQSRKLAQQVDDTRKQLVRPVLDYQKAVNKFASELFDRFKEIEERLTVKVEKWAIEQNKNPFTCLDKIDTEDGCYTIKDVYTFEIVDPKLVPANYLIPNDDAIKEAIDQGARLIPGVKITKKEKSTLRVNNK